jgi:hypothetical protein
MSNRAVEAKTGCTWEKWVMALDYKQAHTWSHRELAEYIHDKFKVPDWWTQTVAVGYERIKGLREIGQRRASRPPAARRSPRRGARVPPSATRLGKWLPDVKLTVRGPPNKSVRITWDDGTRSRSGHRQGRGGHRDVAHQARKPGGRDPPQGILG